MKNNYDTFFKSARAKKIQAETAKKLDIKKLKRTSAENEANLKSTIGGIQNRILRKRQQKLERQFPMAAGFFLGLSLIAIVAISYNSEKFEEILSTIEIKILGTTASAAETAPSSAAKNSQSKDKNEEGTATSENKEKSAEKEKSTSMTEEELSLFKNLDERRKALDLREAELKKLDEELQKQKEELDKRLVQIEQVRKNIANQLEEKVKVDQERVDQLVSFYSTMKPQQAAKIIETLNEDLAVEVLLKMKKKSAAEVMNLMGAEKAQRLSEKFAGYRRK